jgi:hypothetical protein
MVYCRTSTKNLWAIVSKNGCVAALGCGNCNEIGIIPCRREWRDGTSSDVVGYFDDSTDKTCKRKGETI